MSTILELAQSLEKRAERELENMNKATELAITKHNESLSKLLEKGESDLEAVIREKNERILSIYENRTKQLIDKHQSVVKWRWIEIYGLIFGAVLLLILMGLVWSKSTELIELNRQVAKLEQLEGLKGLKVMQEGKSWYLANPTKTSEIYTSKGGDNVLKLN